MSVLRPATSILFRTSRTTFPRSLRTFARAQRAPAQVVPSAPRSSQIRFYSSNSPSSKFYSFAEIQNLSKNPKSSITLIDTREPSELQTTGTIPTSVNIPVTSAPDAFFITPEEFEERFGFERPEKEEEVVFYCKAGVRSRAAAELAKQAGWKAVGEYPGSWMDWEKNNGAKEGGRS